MARVEGAVNVDLEARLAMLRGEQPQVAGGGREGGLGCRYSATGAPAYPDTDRQYPDTDRQYPDTDRQYCAGADLAQQPCASEVELATVVPQAAAHIPAWEPDATAAPQSVLGTADQHAGAAAVIAVAMRNSRPSGSGAGTDAAASSLGDLLAGYGESDSDDDDG
eukprot:SAG11_NODE_1674_length_4478_cov_2.341631_4_plen_165_part_00